MERAVHALDVEDRARRSPPAARSSSSRPSGRRSRPRCSPTSPTRRSCRRASSTSCRGSARRSAPRSSSDPRARRISLTGSPETGRADRRGRGAEPRAVHRPSSAARGRSSSSPTPTSRPPPARPRASTTTPGQVCLAGTRLLVEETVADEFLELFDRFADEHVLGDPRDDATTVSPLIHREHLERVEGFVERARANGDEIVRGGRRREDVGRLFYEPTLVLPRSNESEIVQREVFGPVLTFQRFGDEEAAVAARELDPLRALRRSSSPASAERAERVGRALRAGTVWVNTFLVRDLTAPFGGVGISGIGREGGDYALDFYSDLETLQIKEGTVRR